MKQWGRRESPLSCSPLVTVPESTTSSPQPASVSEPGSRRRELERLRIDRNPVSINTRTASSKRYGWWILAISVVAGVFGWRHWFAPVPEVQTATVGLVYPSQGYTLLNATGYVVPQIKAEVASKATGRLERLEVQEGSEVKRGQIVASVENADLKANLNQAEANVRVAEAKLAEARAEREDAGRALRRIESLLAKQYGSVEARDSAEARKVKADAAIASAEASIAAAVAAREASRVALEYSYIRAPFDGVILEKHAEVGDILAPLAAATQSKGAVVSLADMDTLEVEADVSESSLMQVHPAQPCEIQLDAIPNERFVGEVHRIVPTVDRSKTTVLVKVRFLEHDPRILPEMSAKVAFLSQVLKQGEHRPVTAVPSAAVADHEGMARIFVVRDGKAEAVWPVIRGRIGDFVTVGEEIQPGDKVVLQPPPELTGGMEVRLRE